MSGVANFAQVAYNTIFRRNSTTAIFVITSAFIFERFFNPTADAFFKKINAGVS